MIYYFVIGGFGMLVNIYGYQNETGKIRTFNENLIRGEGNGCALELTVDVPDELNPYESVLGDICIEIDGMGIGLNEILFCDKNGHPWIKYPDTDKKQDITRKLKVVSENGWKDTSMLL